MLGLALPPVAYWTLCASGHVRATEATSRQERHPVLARGYRRPIHAFNTICRCQNGRVWAANFRAASRVILRC
jgi:hypothetical protein